ncbi:mannose-6-phosphate isomerase [Vibrio sp. 10N.286.49.C2]|uniref:AGE family epimerase/isomerase n=1 Tax=unclassified Vibrio TaxID=2614977 RepID=UPI000C85DC94|nr:MULTISPECIES: AGE family epimerase/isomerase [unclassified Vibrio]PMH38825.1 mannose-6-phosphate isomerase [Vibrio sp. 10N.286.49.C2]PMH55301.1 mannose-6-phosphate isomerase [Vibrio sp. 10N.286.49.B1]PMH83804.1 mannose-6-phosphate isomerase [Vibrio sp. 10N.286.48.B7]
MDSLAFQIARSQQWLTKYALPRWQKTQSSQTGIFAEGLLSDGQEFSHDLFRFRVQPRQVYVFAHATKLGLIDGKDQVSAAIKNGFSHFGSETSGYRFSMSRNSEINLYEQAFALLGFAWHYRLTEDKSTLLSMETIYEHISTHLWDTKHGGFFLTEGNTANKGQNPHMHLFEALMVSYEHTDNPIWLERATQIYQLFSTQFLQSDHLAEFFQADFSLTPGIGTHVDPGHHYEWIWLLNHYEKLTGVNVEPSIQTLFTFAQLHGHNTNGLVRDEIYTSGRPLRSTSRLWCQTEYLKACITLWERDPTDAHRSNICQAVEHIFIHYLDPAINGLWIDQVNELGHALNKHSPASSFYHLFLAFSELLRIASKD